MSALAEKLPSAFKHGVYSTATLLPGEDEAAFGHLHESLVAELAPEGALEEHIVANIARFVWRRDRLAILRLSKAADRHVFDLVVNALKLDPNQQEAERAAARAKARKQLGEFAGLLDMEAAEWRLREEIEIRARLDEMIDKGLKRLLFLRGLKSMARPALGAPLAAIAAPAATVVPDGEPAASTPHND